MGSFGERDHGMTAVSQSTDNYWAGTKWGSARALGDELIERAKRRQCGKDVLGRPAGHVVAAEDRLPIRTEWSGMEDYVNAPPDYGTFFRQYKNYTRSLVLKFGVPPSDLDDIITEIMIRFLERDSIGVFSREWKTRSVTGKSNFRSYYSRFVVTYARGKNRNVRKHSSRNLLICDAPIDDEHTVTGIDLLASTVSFEQESDDWMDFESLVSELRAQVDPELAPTVDVIVELAMGAPVIRVAELARALGVSKEDAESRLKLVRSALSSTLR